MVLNISQTSIQTPKSKPKILTKEVISMGILIGVFIVAIFTDMKFYKIPNLLILFGIISGMALTIYLFSYEVALESLICMAVVFVSFYPFYLLGGLGAGDIKLLMMTGCFIRNWSLLNFIFVTLMIAGVISIIKMIIFRESRERLFYLGRYVRKAVITRTVDEYEIDKTNKRTLIRIALPAFMSLMLMCIGVYA
jgi:prepilin peptidase CpaA